MRTPADAHASLRKAKRCRHDFGQMSWSGMTLYKSSAIVGTAHLPGKIPCVHEWSLSLDLNEDKEQNFSEFAGRRTLLAVKGMPTAMQGTPIFAKGTLIAPSDLTIFVQDP